MEDKDIVRGIQELPHLRLLDLSACRKLSPAFVKAALAASDSVAARSPGGTSCRPLDLQQHHLKDLMLAKKDSLLTCLFKPRGASGAHGSDVLCTAHTTSGDW